MKAAFPSLFERTTASPRYLGWEIITVVVKEVPENLPLVLVAVRTMFAKSYISLRVEAPSLNVQLSIFPDPVINSTFIILSDVEDVLSLYRFVVQAYDI